MDNIDIEMLTPVNYNAGHQHPPRLSLKRIFGGFFYA